MVAAWRVPIDAAVNSAVANNLFTVAYFILSSDLFFDEKVGVMPIASSLLI